MSRNAEREECDAREGRIFYTFALCLAGAAMLFGLLNAMNVIHV